MKTFISDLIPKIQRHSQKLDILTLLTDQHWIVVDDIGISKNVYIFRTNNELLISQNGKVEKARWEYLGNNSILLDKQGESYLFKHSFFGENILALKVDGKDEYAFLVNENHCDGELNSLDKITDFLTRTYIDEGNRKTMVDATGIDLHETKGWEKNEITFLSFDTDKGVVDIEQNNRYSYVAPGSNAYMNNNPAPTDIYRFGFMWYVHVDNGKVTKVTLF
jgi:hypothetical protein